MRPIFFLLLMTMACGFADFCQAQSLFGDRQLGASSIRRRASLRETQDTSDAAALSGRFLRDQRTVRDFVGGPVTTATGGAEFVGGLSAATAASSSVTGLVEEVRPPLNRPRVVRSTGTYAERLSLPPAGTAQRDSLSEATSPMSRALQSLIQERGLTIEVFSADRSATLRGAVPSEHERQTAELLLMLEPGIEKVVNEVTIDPSLTPQNLSARRPRVQPPTRRN